MRIMFKRVALPVSVTVAILAFGLIAITSISNIVNPEAPILKSASATAYVNNDTGRITKYVESSGEEVYNEGYSSTDTTATISDNAYFQRAPLNITYFHALTNIHGKAYPSQASLIWATHTMKEFVVFFNDNVAVSLHDSVGKLVQYSVVGAVNGFISNKVHNAYEAGLLPHDAFVENDTRFIDATRNLFAGNGVEFSLKVSSTTNLAKTE